MFPLGDFCRICLTFDGEFCNMDIDDAKEKATACVPDLEFQNDLPTLICSKCSEKLDMYSEFRNQCLLSQFIIKDFVDRFLGGSITSNNTKLQENILENTATTNKSPENVKLQRYSNSTESSQKELTVFLKNIRNFADASLELNKNSCTVEDFKEFCDKSNPMSSELKDFEGLSNANRSDCVSNNVSDCDSDDDDLFIEEEDETDVVQQPESLPSIDIEAEHECDKPISTKRKTDITEGFNKKSKPDQDLDPGVLISTAERVKLRKRQVQIRAQTVNYSKLSSHNVYTTKNYKLQHVHNIPQAGTSESTIPATVGDNLERKLDQISRNDGITTATDFVPDIQNNVKE